MLQRRIMALWLGRFSTDRLARKGASRSEPLLVSIRQNNALYVHALNHAAQRLGLYAGQPLANAHAMVHGLAVVPADESADAALLDAMADWCGRFTPMVALAPPQGLLLDITGAAHLFGGEAAMLKTVTGKIGAQGFSVSGAIAGSATAAMLLARHRPHVIAPAGAEKEALANLPAAALSQDPKIQRALLRAGLKTIAQVMARGRSELAERLGKVFVAGLEGLSGNAPITPRLPQPDLMAEQAFAAPITSRGDIAIVLENLARALASLLEREGKGLRELQAVLFRADGGVARIDVRSGAPLRDPAIMMRLLEQKLDSPDHRLCDPLDPGFGFDLIRLEAVLAEKTTAEKASLDADENAARQVAFLIDRLSARFGAQRIQRFLAQDTHIPEAQSVAVPAQSQSFAGVEWKARRNADDPPLRPLRLLERPEEILSVLAAVPDGPPTRFSWRRCQHQVARAEGPERIAMEWWSVRESGSDHKKNNAHDYHDYFRVETNGGERFWLFRDGAPGGRWYLHGMFA